MGVQGSDVINKIKSALPFQTLPLFELADTGIEPYQTPPQENENADFGPNEVTKGSIGEISLDADNKYDTSTGPGELQTQAFLRPGMLLVCSADTACVQLTCVHSPCMHCHFGFIVYALFRPRRNNLWGEGPRQRRCGSSGSFRGQEQCECFHAK